MDGDLYLATALAAAVAICPDRRSMPLAAITILAVYALSSIDVGNWPNGVPELAGVIVTVALHKWRRNAALSILGATLVCIALANTLPPV